MIFPNLRDGKALTVDWMRTRDEDIGVLLFDTRLNQKGTKCSSMPPGQSV